MICESHSLARIYTIKANLGGIGSRNGSVIPEQYPFLSPPTSQPAEGIFSHKNENLMVERTFSNPCYHINDGLVKYLIKMIITSRFLIELTVTIKLKLYLIQNVVSFHFPSCYFRLS